MPFGRRCLRRPFVFSFDSRSPHVVVTKSTFEAAGIQDVIRLARGAKAAIAQAGQFYLDVVDQYYSGGNTYATLAKLLKIKVGIGTESPCGQYRNWFDARKGGG
jgi:hypothetical protein